MQTIKNKYQKSETVKQLENLIFDFRKKRDGANAVKKYYSDHNATELEKCIIHYTIFRGWQAEKVVSMGRITYKGGENPIFIRNNNTSGQADISLTVSGRSIKVEVKCKWTKDRYQNEAQKKYQRKIEKAGGIYLIIREFSDFKTFLDNYIQNLR